MKYVAWLRGINVGGKSLVKMSDLKAAFQNAGFEDVVTYINSGNVIFGCENNDIQALTDTIEKFLTEAFFPLRVVVVSQDTLEAVLLKVPEQWRSSSMRRYIAFVKAPATPEDVIKEVQLKPEVDSIEGGTGVVYMTTQLAGISQSGFSKLAGKKIYQQITMRDFNTVQKIYQLMKEN